MLETPCNNTFIISACRRGYIETGFFFGANTRCTTNESPGILLKRLFECFTLFCLA